MNQGPVTDAPIELRPWSTAWRRVFQRESRALCDVLGPWLVGMPRHIGSTAVPGLAAKPVIDIMAPIGNLRRKRRAIIAAAQEDGWCHAPYKADEMLWFCKPSLQHRRYHLHLLVPGSPGWWARLDFRNALRADAALAARYEALKRDLAARFPHDREAYTEGKSAFIAEALAAWRAPRPPATPPR